MKKLNFLKPLKLLIIYIFGYKNDHNLQVCLVRFLKKIPLYYYFPEETKISKNIIIGKKNSEVFFGYYDITPFDYSGNKILCHIYDQKKNAKEIYLGYVNINSRKEPKIKIFSKTEVWCWQMGSRLQWFPSSSNNLVIFNTIIKDNYGAVVKNTENSEIIYSFDKPIYSLANSGKSALYLNFNRLHRLRPGYGYRNFKDNTNRELAPENDGLFKLDLETGKS